MTLRAPLYLRVLGDAWTSLAEPVRSLHDTSSSVHACGYLRITHGRHIVARVLARILRLPPPGDAAATRLTVTARDGGERWHRTMNGRQFETRQYESCPSELAERLGSLELRFRLAASGGSLLYTLREAAFLIGPVRLRLPAAWAPRIDAREDAAGPSAVKVSVRVFFPRVRPLIAYDGVIEVQTTRE